MQYHVADLHTHHAARIWHGRPPIEDRPGIVGLNGFMALMNKLKRGVEQDDPYSDRWMLRIEEKLEQTKAGLQTSREQVDQALAGVPPALSLGENLNVQPVKLPLFINSSLGFKAVYLLADFDELARRLILAHHTALIDRNTLERWLNDGAVPFLWHSNTAILARRAIEKFGQLPREIIDGTRRSRFAPPLAQRESGTKAAAGNAEAAAEAASEAGLAASDGGAADDEAPA